MKTIEENCCYTVKMLDKVADFVTEKIGMKFPTLPKKIEDTYLVDATEKTVREKDWQWPNQSLNQILDALTLWLKDNNKLPEPGTQYLGYTWENKQLLFGKKITSGNSNDIHHNLQTNQVTHLWQFSSKQEEKTQNDHQMKIYRENADKSPQFTFTREVPGGWMEPYIENVGDLKDYLTAGNNLTEEQVQKAVADLKHMQDLSHEAHGDLVKRADFVQFWNYRSAYEKLEKYGYLNYQNIMVDPQGNLIIRDYAGNYNPSSIGGWEDQDRNNVKSPIYMANELRFFEEGLRSLLPGGEKIPPPN